MADENSAKVTSSERTGARSSGFSVDDLLTRIGSSSQKESDVTTSSSDAVRKLEAKVAVEELPKNAASSSSAFDLHGNYQS